MTAPTGTDRDTLLDLEPKTPDPYWALASSVARALNPLELWKRVAGG